VVGGGAIRYFCCEFADVSSVMSLNNVNWERAKEARRLVAAEMKPTEAAHQELTSRLRAAGLHQTSVLTASKLSRPSFCASPFFVAMKAAGRESVISPGL
jgi:Domain of unknown function (DUF6471)